MRYRGYELTQKAKWVWEAVPDSGRAGPVFCGETAQDVKRKIDTGVAAQVVTVKMPREDELIGLDALALARLRAEALRDGGGSGGIDWACSTGCTPYTLRDHEAAVWRNRPNADESLYDAPVIEPYAPRTRTAIWLLGFPLAWAILGALAWGLMSAVSWVFDAPMAVAAVAAAALICAGFLLLMWVRR